MTEAASGKKLRILLVHNRYQQRGGEDAVFEEEVSLLIRAGHEVHRLEVSNDSIRTRFDSLRVAKHVARSKPAMKLVSDRVKSVSPDVVHIHNFFPLLTPGIHEAVSSLGTPVVQTFHNYRFSCANAQFLRNGRPCTKCIQGGPKWGIVHGCYRGSRLASAPVARLIAVLRSREWQSKVDRFVALTGFARDKMLESGFEHYKISVVPNSISTVPRKREVPTEFTALFVGRLSEEKGVQNLLSAMKNLRDEGVSLKLRVVGDGPLSEDLKSRTGKLGLSNIEFLGAKTREEVAREMSRSTVLLFPSIWFEGFPMVLAEAMAAGLPVIASRIGGIPEIVDENETGQLCDPFNPSEWTSAIMQLMKNPAMLEKLSRAGMERARSHFSSEKKAELLHEVYADVIRNRGRNAS